MGLSTEFGATGEAAIRPRLSEQSLMVPEEVCKYLQTGEPELFSEGATSASGSFPLDPKWISGHKLEGDGLSAVGNKFLSLSSDSPALASLILKFHALS